ncbi:MAG: UbiX family flavin prenyltransferase [Planctomycetaceae bacterium]
MKPIVLAVTGASGSIYAIRLLEVLLAAGRDVQLCVSPAGAEVVNQELDIQLDLRNLAVDQLLPSLDNLVEDGKLAPLLSSSSNVISSIFSESDITRGQVEYHHYKDFSAGIASGSFATEGMVICPCSMGTLGSLANGLSANLIHRAADVHLKERRKLIVVPRETPLSGIQLDNMKRLSDAGAVVLPAMPGFYHNPMTIHDLIDFVVGRICDQLGIRIDMIQRWGK